MTKSVEKNVQISLWLTYQDKDMTIEEYKELMELMGTDDDDDDTN